LTAYHPYLPSRAASSRGATSLQGLPEKGDEKDIDVSKVVRLAILRRDGSLPTFKGCLEKRASLGEDS
jgi:hypothetical protein